MQFLSEMRYCVHSESQLLHLPLNYQQQLQKKQNDMLKPIFDKADKAISDVAKEKGLIYVFDISSRVVLYQSPLSLDLMPLAKAKLGIK